MWTWCLSLPPSPHPRQLNWSLRRLPTKMRVSYTQGGQSGQWTILGRKGLNGTRFHHTTQTSMQFKTCELFISVIFHFIFSDHSCPRVTETAESKKLGIKGLCIYKADEGPSIESSPFAQLQTSGLAFGVPLLDAILDHAHPIFRPQFPHLYNKDHKLPSCQRHIKPNREGFN